MIRKIVLTIHCEKVSALNFLMSPVVRHVDGTGTEAT